MGIIIHILLIIINLYFALDEKNPYNRLNSFVVGFVFFGLIHQITILL